MTPRVRQLLLAGAPAGLLAAVAGVFAALSPKFLTADNVVNVLVQSSSGAVAAAGVTVVLLASGIDLSVGSVMLLGAALCGKLLQAGWPTWMGALAMLAAGVACGRLNGWLVTRGGAPPFIVTLATLFVFRGLGLQVSQTRAMNLPDELRQVATARVAGVPGPVLVMAAVLLAGHWLVTRTAFGRQLLAVGHDAAAARTAGVDVGRVLRRAYTLCGACAAVGGLIALAQLGAVSPTFGQGRELDAIAAAVLGGTALSGGRGAVLPNAFLGAVTVQVVFNGLNLVNADPYCYPLVTSGIIFAAVLLDSLRRPRGARA